MSLHSLLQAGSSAPHPQEVQLKLSTFPESVLRGRGYQHRFGLALIWLLGFWSIQIAGKMCSTLGAQSWACQLSLDSFAYGMHSLILVSARLQTYLQSPPLDCFGHPLHLLGRLMTYTRAGSEKIC